MAADLAIKEPCRAATTANITLSGLQTIDGVSLAANDRVLVKAQTSAVNNGIYLAASGGWTRATDMDGAGEAAGGTQVLVTSGTAYGGTSWRIAGAGAITIGSSAINFELAIDSDSVAFQASGSGSVARTVDARLRDDALAPEDFGALGDGTANDAGAFAALITAAQSLGLPIRLRQAATYALGAASWAGLSATLSRDLFIDGNGAKIKLLVQPSQGHVIGTGNPVFKFDGTASTYRLTIRDLRFDLNGISASCVAPYRCRLDISGCSFTGYNVNSPYGFGVYANTCSGDLTGNEATAISYMFYLGHTDDGYYCSNLRVIGNRASGLAADFCVGVMKNSAIVGNLAHDLYGGIAFAAYSGTGMFSENLSIAGNVISSFTGGGVHSDVVQVAEHDEIFNKNVAVTGNSFVDAPGTGEPIHMHRIDGFTVAGNTFLNCNYNINVFRAFSGAITGNRISAGSASSPVSAIRINGQLGDAHDLQVTGNTIEGGFSETILIGGVPQDGIVSRVTVTGNSTRGSVRGLYIADDVEDISVDANSFTGSSSADIYNVSTNGVNGVRFGKNLFDTSTGVWYPTTYDPPNLANGAQQSTNVTVTGAAVGDFAEVAFSNALSGTQMWAEVTAANTVTVYHRNGSGGAVNLASGTLRVQVTRK